MDKLSIEIVCDREGIMTITPDVTMSPIELVGWLEYAKNIVLTNRPIKKEIEEGEEIEGM